MMRIKKKMSVLLAAYSNICSNMQQRDVESG